MPLSSWQIFDCSDHHTNCFKIPMITMINCTVIDSDSSLKIWNQHLLYPAFYMEQGKVLEYTALSGKNFQDAI